MAVTVGAAGALFALADADSPPRGPFTLFFLLAAPGAAIAAVLRAQSRTAGLAWLQGLLCVLVLGLTLLLLPRTGLVGAGIAEVSSLAVIVLLAAPRLYRILRTAPSDAVPEDTPPDGDLADLGPVARKPGSAWARPLDSDTLALGIHVDFDHQERRPDIRPGPGTPPTGTPAVRHSHRPTWALRIPLPEQRTGLPLEKYASPAAEEDAGGSEGVRGADRSATERVEPDPRVRPTPSVRPEIEALPVRRIAAPAHEAVELPAPALRERLPRPTTPGVLLGCLLISALLLYWVPALELDDAALDGMGGLGLVSVLPVPTPAGADVPADALDAGGLARQVDGDLDLRAEQLGRPGLLLPPGLHVPALPGLRRDPAGVVPCAAHAVGQGPPRRGGGGADGPPAARGAADDPDRAVRGDGPGPPADALRDAGRARGPGPDRPLGAARPPVLCTVMVTVWIGFLAEPYWSGHFDELFGGVGGVGGVGGNVTSSVSGRIG